MEHILAIGLEIETIASIIGNIFVVGGLFRLYRAIRLSDSITSELSYIGIGVFMVLTPATLSEIFQTHPVAPLIADHSELSMADVDPTLRLRESNGTTTEQF